VTSIKGEYQMTVTVPTGCGDSGCIMPGVPRGGWCTNGGCRCHKEDVARAHEAIAARLRGAPSWHRGTREDKQRIDLLVAKLEEASKEIVRMLAVVALY